MCVMILHSCCDFILILSFDYVYIFQEKVPLHFGKMETHRQLGAGEGKEESTRCPRVLLVFPTSQNVNCFDTNGQSQNFSYNCWHQDNTSFPESYLKDC